MSLDADAIVARRRLKRQLGLWRVLAIVAAVAAVIAGVGRFGGFFGQDHVARLTVSGLIVEDGARDTALAALADDGDVQALIVHINSPGGSVVGGEDLYNALRQVSEQKPVVAIMGTLATSAAYMTAVAADQIFAREGTITGSIGVLLQTTEVTQLLDKLGIKAEAIKSSPLKAQPSPVEPLTPDARAAAAVLVLDMYTFFVDLVAERRDLEDDEALRLADGRVFTGRQAVTNGLIDDIGGEGAARDWLRDARDIGMDLPIRDVVIDRGDLLTELATGLAEKTLISKALTLDGLIALWHPDLR